MTFLYGAIDDYGKSLHPGKFRLGRIARRAEPLRDNPIAPRAQADYPSSMTRFFSSLMLLACLLHGHSAFAAHAFALHGEPKYPAGFSHFDYVNPDAPKRGQLNVSSMGNFDKLNPYT